MNLRGFLLGRAITYGIVAILLIISALSVLSLAGCTSGETGQGATEDEEVCPDTLLSVSEAFLSSAIDENGKPVNVTNIFTQDTPEIFFSLVLSDDEVCCSTVTMQWVYGGEVIDMWQDYSNYPSRISLNSPEGGFSRGEYEVAVYIEINEIIRVPFTIE
jgi:hypothetical protein